MNFSNSNVNSAFLLSSKPTFNTQEPQITLPNLQLNSCLPEILPFLFSQNSQLLLKNSSVTQFSLPSSYSQTAFPLKKVKTEDGQSNRSLEMFQKLNGINPTLASSIISDSQTQIKNPLLSTFHSAQSNPLQNQYLNLGSDLKKKINEDSNYAPNPLSGFFKQIQTHAHISDPSSQFAKDTFTQIKLAQNIIPMAHPGLLEVQKSEIIINPALTGALFKESENFQNVLKNNLLNYQRQSLHLPILNSQLLAFNDSNGNLNSLLNFQTNSNSVGSQLLFSNPSSTDCSNYSQKDSVKNPLSSEESSPAKKQSKTRKKILRKQQEKSEDQSSNSVETDFSETSPKMVERRLNKLQKMRLQQEEEITKRRAEMLQNGESLDFVEPQMTRELVGEEAIQDFLVNIEKVYSDALNENNKERAIKLLAKFNWNIPKVVDSVKKNKSYYKKYLDGLTGN